MEDDIAGSDFSLVEWPSVGGELFDFPAIVVTISFGENENDRNIRIEGDFDERS
jgi:tRNA A37 threonylcarbamoyladenosine biosynthesis protein TsaE